MSNHDTATTTIAATRPVRCRQCGDPNPMLHELDGHFCDDRCVTNYRVSDYRVLAEAMGVDR